MRLFPEDGHRDVQGEGYLKRVILGEGEIGLEGTLLQEVRFRKGESVRMHFHQATKEVFYCLEGPAPFVINGEKVVMRQGDCLICEPGDVHGNPEIKNDFRILVLKVGMKEDDTVWL